MLPEIGERHAYQAKKQAERLLDEKERPGVVGRGDSQAGQVPVAERSGRLKAIGRGNRYAVSICGKSPERVPPETSPAQALEALKNTTWSAVAGDVPAPAGPGAGGVISNTSGNVGLILSRSRGETECLLAQVRVVLGELGLEISESKTGISHRYRGGFDFLGFHVSGRAVSPSEQVVERFALRLTELRVSLGRMGLKKALTAPPTPNPPGTAK